MARPPIRRRSGIAALAVILVLVVAQPVAAGAGDVVALSGRLGTNGSVTLRSSNGTTGTITLKLTGLKARARYVAAIYAGTCAKPGPTIVPLPALQATAAGKIVRTASLTSAQVDGVIRGALERGGVIFRATSGARQSCAKLSGTVKRAPKITASISLAGTPVAIAVGGGSTWVANLSGENVIRIDPTTNRVAAFVSLDTDPATVPYSLAYGEGALWVGSPAFAADGTPASGSVARIDPSGQVVATIGTGVPYSIATGFGAVWVADSGGGTLVRIDPQTNAVAATITIGAMPTSVAIGAGAVWVASSAEGTVTRVDPATNTVTAVIPTGPAYSVAATSRAIWVTSPSGGDAPIGTLVQIDPALNQVSGSIALTGRPVAVAATDADVWVALDRQSTVVHLDVATQRVESLRVQPGPWSLAIDGRSVWVAEMGPMSNGQPGGAGSVERIAF
ncbi:MAG TPA: hypothetical protein VIV06_12295 [Candidatus Limnocylindrales bacterium]